MLIKVKSSVFIDALKFQLHNAEDMCLRGILKDDKGSICRTMERNIHRDREEIIWEGLNDLPYGRYTLEISHGEEEMRMHLVKRV